MAELVLKRPMAQEKSLQEFLYTVLMELSLEQRKSLPERIRKHINTAKRAQKFIERSSTDQKRELFTYLNLSSFFVVTPIGILGNRDFLDVIEQFRYNSITEGIRAAVKSNIFVSGDRDFAFTLGGLSQIMASAPYVQHLELKRAANVVRHWPKKIKHEDDNELDSIDIVKLVLWSGMNWERTKGVAGLTSNYMKVLCFLYIHKSKYVERERISRFFAGEISNIKLLAIYRNLVDGLYAQQHPDVSIKRLTITKFGIKAVNQLRDKILKSLEF